MAWAVESRFSDPIAVALANEQGREFPKKPGSVLLACRQLRRCASMEFRFQSEKSHQPLIFKR